MSTELIPEGDTDRYNACMSLASSLDKMRACPMCALNFSNAKVHYSVQSPIFLLSLRALTNGRHQSVTLDMKRFSAATRLVKL